MRAAEIKTQMDLQAWLEGQSQEVCVWIAAREFAQRLPLYWSETALKVGKGQDNVELLTFYRSLLTALTFAHAKNDALKARLGSAATQVTTAANPAAKDAVGVLSRAWIDAFFVAQATAVASEAAENASAVAKTRAFVDAQWAEAEGVTEARRLWVEEMPDYTMAALRAMLDALPEPAHDQPDYRSFWVPWYQGLLDGKPAFPQALTEAVALIPEDDWKQGEVHINNTVIPRLMAEHGAFSVFDASDLDAGMIDRPTASSKIKTVRAQVETLQGFLASEVDALRGHNARNAEQDAMLALLKDLKTLAENMMERLAETNDEGQSISVVHENLPAIFEKTGELATVEQQPQVSSTVATMSATIASLVDAGADPTLATKYAMSEAAGRKLWPRLRRFFGWGEK